MSEIQQQRRQRRQRRTAPPARRFLSVKHAAHYMDMGESTLWALIKRYKDTCGRDGLPVYHPSPGQTRLKIDDLDIWMENKRWSVA